MTLPFERTRAVLNTQEFLRALLDPKKTPKVPLHIRKVAKSLLKHYPGEYDMDKLLLSGGNDVFGKYGRV